VSYTNGPFDWNIPLAELLLGFELLNVFSGQVLSTLFFSGGRPRDLRYNRRLSVDSSSRNAGKVLFVFQLPAKSLGILRNKDPK
jgi:hypothetical protein